MRTSLANSNVRSTAECLESARERLAVANEGRRRAEAGVEEACGVVGVHWSGHTLRKTFGYQQYKRGVPPLVIMEMFAHTSQKATFKYICVQTEEVHNAYISLNL